MKISIIIPVLNEEKIINHLLAHLVSIIKTADTEIIISDGHSDATTLAAIEDQFLRFDQIKTIKSEKNRGIQMNTGAEIASGEILLFLHADTVLPENAFEDICFIMKDYAAGAFRLSIDSGKLRYRLIEKMINLRTAVTNTPYGDQALFIKKDVFFSLNGFFSYPVMEDIDFIRKLKKTGEVIHISVQKVITSARRWEREGVIKCTLRNWYLLIQYHCGIDPEKLAAFYQYNS